MGLGESRDSMWNMECMFLGEGSINLDFQTDPKDDPRKVNTRT